MLIGLVLTEIQAFKNVKYLQRNVWKTGQIRTNAMNSIDDECDNDLPEELVSLPPETSQTLSGIATYNQPSAIRDEELRDAVRSLNVKQRITYDVVLSWCRNSIKSVNCLTKETIEPIYIFVTGGGGGGKSHSIRTIYHTAVSMFKYSESVFTNSSANGTYRCCSC